MKLKFLLYACNLPDTGDLFVYQGPLRGQRGERDQDAVLPRSLFPSYFSVGMVTGSKKPLSCT